MRVKVVIRIVAILNLTLGVSMTRSSLPNQVVRFLLDNNVKHLNVIFGDSHRHSGVAIGLTSATASISTSMTALGGSISTNDIDFNLILLDFRDQSELLTALNIISKSKVKSSALMLPGGSILERFVSDHLETLRLNSFFYLAVAADDDSRLQWFQAITTRSGQAAVNRIRFRSAASLAVDDGYFDLNGMQIASLSLDWAPYLTFSDCDRSGKKCTGRGYMMDYAEMVGREFNFSCVSHREENGDWGILPTEGDVDSLNATWVGAMGSVVTGKYDTSLSAWTWNVERNKILSFVGVVPSRNVLAVSPKNPDTDYGLFVRPFSEATWAAILVVTLIAVACLVVPFAATRDVESTTGHQEWMAVMVTWYFFVLVNAFYGGALVMFFASSVSLPFSTVREVIAAHPAWKLMMQRGNEIQYAYRAFAGDPDYQKFWQRIQTDPENSVFGDMGEGLERIRNGQYVIHVTEGMLKGHFKAHPEQQQSMKIFGREKRSYVCLIFGLNSPLQPLFAKASAKLRESGAEAYLLNKWEGQDVSEELGSESVVLTGGHVILVLLIMTGAFGASAAALIAEMVVGRGKRRKRRLWKAEGSTYGYRAYKTEYVDWADNPSFYRRRAASNPM